jgi:hypothetical protein
MSVGNYDEGTIHRPELGECDRLPEPFPWCLACGYQHPQADHREGCNGDHSAGYCMTDELAEQLANLGSLRELIGLEAGRLFNQVLHIVRTEGGE